MSRRYDIDRFHDILHWANDIPYCHIRDISSEYIGQGLRRIIKQCLVILEETLDIAGYSDPGLYIVLYSRIIMFRDHGLIGRFGLHTIRVNFRIELRYHLSRRGICECVRCR